MCANAQCVRNGQRLHPVKAEAEADTAGGRGGGKRARGQRGGREKVAAGGGVVHSGGDR